MKLTITTPVIVEGSYIQGMENSLEEHPGKAYQELVDQVENEYGYDADKDHVPLHFKTIQDLKKLLFNPYTIYTYDYADGLIINDTTDYIEIYEIEIERRTFDEVPWVYYYLCFREGLIRKLERKSYSHGFNQRYG